MACIEFHINGKKFKIFNDETQSEVYQTSDWEIVKTIINENELPKGYFISNEDSNITFEEFVTAITEAINQESENNNTLLRMLTDNKITRTDFINKLVGNSRFDDALGYDAIFKDKYSNNALYIPRWGGKKWFGFTNQRAIMISGQKHVSYKNVEARTLLEAYYMLRDDNSKFVIDIIKKLSSVHQNPYTDIYEQFTWLANTHRLELVKALKLPGGTSALFDNARAARKSLKQNASSYIGHIIYLNNELYSIVDRGDKDQIRVKNIKNKKTLLISIDDIYNIYEPFSVIYDNNTYIFIHNKWYKETKNGMDEVLDTNLVDELFRTFFGIHDDEFKIDVYDDTNFVTLDTQIGDITLNNLLPIGSKVFTASGIYTKDLSGNFTQGTTILSTEPIYQIATDNSISENLMQLKQLDPPKDMITLDEVKWIMSDIYGFKDFDILKDNFKQREPIKVTIGTIDGATTLKLTINFNELELTSNNLRLIKTAINYYNYVKNNPGSEYTEVNTIWPKIIKFIKGVKSQDDLFQEFASKLSPMIEESELLEIKDYLEQNLNNFKNESHIGYNDVDTLIDELIDNGILRWSCKV